MTWQVIRKPLATDWAARGAVVELANGKPPYQWKHGWIPITPDAKLIKAKKKRGSATDTPEHAEAPKPERKIGGKPASEAYGGLTPEEYWARFDQERTAKKDPSSAPSQPASRASGTQQSRFKANSFETDDPKMQTEFERVVKENEIKLNYMEQDVLTWYVQDSGPMNDFMRHGSKEVDEIDQQAKVLSAAIQRSKLKKRTTVYRGMVVNQRDQFLPGDVITDKGFSSTSYDPAVARHFAESTGGQASLKPVLIEIDAPAGTSALVVNAKKYNLDYWQSELIMGSGQPFRIISVSEDGTYIRAEAVIRG